MKTKPEEWYVYELFVVGKRDDVRYVGKTDNLRGRMSDHLYAARTKNGTARLTHRSKWVRSVERDGGVIGIEAISSWWTEESAYIEEERVIAYHNAMTPGRLTNHADGGKGSSGVVFTPERIAKMRQAGKLAHSPEARAKREAGRAAFFADPVRVAVWRANLKAAQSTPEMIALKIARATGRIASPQERARRKALWADPTYRKKMRDAQSAESLAALSERMKGNTLGTAHKGRVMSPEWIERMAGAKRGRPLPKETHAKALAANTGRKMPAHVAEAVRAAQLGSKRTPETKAKQRVAKLGKPWTEARRSAYMLRVGDKSALRDCHAPA